jgi:hypothetical protein
VIAGESWRNDSRDVRHGVGPTLTNNNLRLNFSGVARGVRTRRQYNLWAELQNFYG